MSADHSHMTSHMMLVARSGIARAIVRLITLILFLTVKAGCSERKGDEARAVSKEAGKAYRLNLSVEKSTPERAEGRVDVVPVAPYKINLEYPLHLDIIAPRTTGSVTPVRRRLGRKDVSVMTPARLVLRAKFLLTDGRSGAGIKDRPPAEPIRANFHFSVCTDESCEVIKEKLVWRIQ